MVFYIVFIVHRIRVYQKEDIKCVGNVCVQMYFVFCISCTFNCKYANLYSFLKHVPNFVKK